MAAKKEAPAKKADPAKAAADSAEEGHAFVADCRQAAKVAKASGASKESFLAFCEAAFDEE